MGFWFDFKGQVQSVEDKCLFEDFVSFITLFVAIYVMTHTSGRHFSTFTQHKATVILLKTLKQYQLELITIIADLS